MEDRTVPCLKKKQSFFFSDEAVIAILTLRQSRSSVDGAFWKKSRKGCSILETGLGVRSRRGQTTKNRKKLFRLQDVL